MTKNKKKSMRDDNNHRVSDETVREKLDEEDDNNVKEDLSHEKREAASTGNDENYQNMLANMPSDVNQLKNLLLHNLITNHQHQVQIKDLEKTKQEVETELEEQKKENSSKLRDLEDKLEYNLGRKEELKGEVEDLKKEVEDLKESLEEKRDQIENMFNANKIVGENIEKLKVENVNVKKQNRNIVLNNLKNIQEIKDENKELKETIDSNNRLHSKEMTNLNNHIKILESKVNSLLSCKYCYKAFEDETHLIRHIDSFHCTIKKQISCRLCSKCFHTNEDMETHVSTEHKQKIEKESLLKKQNELLLKINQQKVILFEKILTLKRSESDKSGKCNCRGTCKINHIKHRWIKPKSDKYLDRVNTVQQTDKSISARKNFSCTQCDQTFTENRKCMNHVELVHATRAQLLCEECAQTFTEDADLRRHMETNHITNENSTVRIAIKYI